MVDPDPPVTDPSPPPVDIDDRDAEIHHAEPPDVIELPDHAEPDEPAAPKSDAPDVPADEVSNETADAGGDPREPWQSDSYVDPVTEDVPWNASGETHGEHQTAPGAITPDDAAADEPDEPGPAAATTDTDEPARTVTLKAERDTRSDDDPHVQERVVDDRPLSERPGAAGEIGRIGAGLSDRVLRPLRQFVQPTLRQHWTSSHLAILLGGAVLILVALLASSAGTALIVASALVSILIVLGLTQQDVFEHESSLLITGVGVIGGVIGLIIGALESWLANSNWFDSGQLNYGAAGFGGRFADRAGTAPFSVWFLNGLILPLVALAAIAVAPVALRRLPQFRNEVMDGVILVGASAAGFATGTALVFWAPMLGDRGPQTSVGDWTLTTIGVVLLRPVVITLAGAMLGAGIWRYMILPRISTIIVPAAGSIGAFLLLTTGSIQIQPAALWLETIWTLLVAAAAFVVYRTVLRNAIATDRSVLGEDGARMVCPTCQQVTPPGTFCANCGEALPEPTETTQAGTSAAG